MKNIIVYIIVLLFIITPLIMYASIVNKMDKTDKTYLSDQNKYIIFDGDSITEGGVIGNFKYSEHLMTVNPTFITQNYAIGGSLIPENTNNNNNICYRYKTIKQNHPVSDENKYFLHILIGTNDLDWANMNSSTVIYNLSEYTKRASNDGYKIIIGTILPRNWSEKKEKQRISVNEAIKNKVIYSDFVIDYASSPFLTNPNDTNIYVDGIHPSVLGSKLMAEYLNKNSVAFATLE